MVVSLLTDDASIVVFDRAPKLITNFKCVLHSYTNLQPSNTQVYIDTGSINIYSKEYSEITVASLNIPVYFKVSFIISNNINFKACLNTTNVINS